MSHDSNVSTEGGGSRGMVGGAIIVIAIIFFVLYLYGKKQDTPPSLPPTPTAPMASTRTVVKKVGKEVTLYRFAEWPNQCAMAELKSDASFYPKGGTVTIHPPEGGTPWDDTPGVPSTASGTNQPPGWYMVCKKHPESWGVEIWN